MRAMHCCKVLLGSLMIMLLDKCLEEENENVFLQAYQKE